MKKGDKEELFNRNKILSGVIRACEKRPVDLHQVEALVDEIENDLKNSRRLKVRSYEIGKLILTKLHKLDHVAYIRFASVYRKFGDVKEFIKEVNDILVEQEGEF